MAGARSPAREVLNPTEPKSFTLMCDAALTMAAGLLKEARARKVIISYTNGDLTIKYPREKKPDSMFLEKLKTHKDGLRAYFDTYASLPDSGQADALPPDIFFNGTPGYRMCATQLYWVEEWDKEYKDRLFGLIMRKIEGPFDVSSFRRAMRYVVARHESLRSRFFQCENTWYMTVRQANEQAFEVDYRDLRKAEPDNGEILALINFEGHCFDCTTEPLFLVRLLQVHDDEYFLSVKIHHVVFDGWSADVLLRDMFLAYKACLRGEAEPLPGLPFQYKDYLHFQLEYMREHYAADKRYWENLYQDLPSEMIIPAERVDGQKRIATGIAHTAFFLLKDKNQELNRLAGKHSTSLFVVLHTLFNLYLLRITGQPDVIIGSAVFGRDGIVGADEQIGCYALMRLIRTVLDSSDDLDATIGKVKKANEDTQNYVAYTLLDIVEAHLGPRKRVFGTVCKIKLNYFDKNGFFWNADTEEDSFPGMPAIKLLDTVPETEAQISCDFDIHFINDGDSIHLKTLYDTGLYDHQATAGIMEGFIRFVENIISSS